MAEILGVNSRESMYRLLCSHWKDPEALVLGATEPATVLSNPQQWGDLPNFNEQMMYLDTVSYLPGDILTKVDRASMGVSLESRVPFLDPRVVEVVWSLPLSLKIRDSKTKWLLRQVLHKYGIWYSN